MLKAKFKDDPLRDTNTPFFIFYRQCPFLMAAFLFQVRWAL